MVNNPPNGEKIESNDKDDMDRANEMVNNGSSIPSASCLHMQGAKIKPTKKNKTKAQKTRKEASVVFIWWGPACEICTVCVEFRSSCDVGDCEFDIKWSSQVKRAIHVTIDLVNLY